MSDRICAWLLRLYPASFRAQYAEEARALYEARLRDETGFACRARLCYDLLRDLVVGLPQAYRNSGAGAAVGLAANGGPCFRLLESEPLRPESILGGSMLALTGALIFSFAMTSPRLLPVYAANAPLTPIESVMQRVNAAISPDAGGNAENGAVAAGAAAAAGQQGQTSQIPPQAFEVVSIRRDVAPPGGTPRPGPTPDGFHLINMPLFALFQMAYAPSNERAILRGDRIAGAPAWLLADQYDVVAKVGDADLAAWQNSEQQQTMLRTMLQSMLAERLQAVVHHENKEVPVYNLVLAKGGPKFKPAETFDPAELRQKHPGGGMMTGGGMAVQGADGIHFYGISLAQLGDNYLTNMAGRPVVDKTGLTGRFDLAIPISAMPPPPGFAETASRAPSPQDTSPAASTEDESVFTALPEALGLRLEPAKGLVDTIVIDHVERPSEN